MRRRFLRTRFSRIVALFVLLFLVVYFSAYFVLSREGMKDARVHHYAGYFFTPPSGENSFRFHRFCRRFFFLPILLEEWFGDVPSPVNTG